MKVRDLIKKLESVELDTPVVIPGMDHSYLERVQAFQTLATVKANSHLDQHMFEFWGEEHLNEGDTTTPVFVIQSS